MSNYEGMSGKGLVMKKDIKILKQRLIEAHNIEIGGLKPKELKDFGYKKASNRTTTFPIIRKFYDDEQVTYYTIGAIAIYPDEGRFFFDIHENNHSVDYAGDSKTFQVLMSFLQNLPNKGKKYGAVTYYWSEYIYDDFGNSGAGEYTFYGSWEE